MNKILYFKFKGDRNYNHGSDIFNLIDDNCSSFGMRISSVVIRKFTSNHLELVIGENPEPGNIIVCGKLVDESGELHSFNLHDTGMPVQDRREFDEDSIVINSIVDGDEIRLSKITGYSVIEHVIALTKKLSYTLSPLEKGKWIFAQLQLSSPLPREANSISIIRESCVADRFSRNRIIINDSSYGTIQFVVAHL